MTIEAFRKCSVVTESCKTESLFVIKNERHQEIPELVKLSVFNNFILPFRTTEIHGNKFFTFHSEMNLSTKQNSSAWISRGSYYKSSFSF